MGAFPYRAPAEKEPKSAGSGGGFVPSARIFKTGGAKLTLRHPEKYAGKLRSLSVSIFCGGAALGGKGGVFFLYKGFPAKCCEAGRLPLTPTVKKSAAILSSQGDKKRGGNGGLSPPFARAFGISAAGSEWGNVPKRTEGDFYAFRRGG